MMIAVLGADIGYQRIDLKDPSRNNRPIRVDHWYPAAASKQAPLKFGDYWESRDEFVRRATGLGAKETAAREASDRLLAEPMQARKGARPASGTFPLVVLPGDAAEQGLLGESLAARGFRVAAVAQRGTFDTEFMAGPADLESLAADLGFALGHFAGDRAACLGHAIGSTACASLAMRDRRIHAVISYEGGLPSPFEQALLRGSPFYDVAALRVPMLVVHAPHPSIDPRLLDEYVFARQLRVPFPKMSEFNFLSYGLAPGLITAPGVERTSDSLRFAIEVVGRFLDQELRADEAARRWLTSPPAESAQFTGEWTRREGITARVTVADLRTLVRSSGVGGVEELCSRFECSRILPQDRFRELQTWMQWQPPAIRDQILQLLKLRAKTYPSSARARAALALAAHQAQDLALFRTEARIALDLLERSEDATLDTATRNRLKRDIEQRL